MLTLEVMGRGDRVSSQQKTLHDGEVVEKAGENERSHVRRDRDTVDAAWDEER